MSGELHHKHNRIEDLRATQNCESDKQVELDEEDETNKPVSMPITNTISSIGYYFYKEATSRIFFSVLEHLV